ncbi:MAG: GTPase Era [Bacteroidetes bacterium]|nr:GTPase Era [Bacteroidota bacterium]
MIKDTKCGIVTIFGRPNAGKSTLTNKLMRYDLSIVNKKAQTTRNKILGVLTEDNYQIIFTDTPGILEPKYELQQFMIKEISFSLKDADVLLHVVDVNRFDINDLELIHSSYGKQIEGKPKILAFNKSDLAKDNIPLQTLEKLEKYDYKEVVFISALKNKNVDVLKSSIVNYLPDAAFLYDEDYLTDRPEKFFIAEIIREKILSFYSDEIPYSTFVNILQFKERDSGKIYINAEIIIERETQKKIIIGRNGEGIKKLGQQSRKAIENFLERSVYLELFVKIRKGWRDSEGFIKGNM